MNAEQYKDKLLQIIIDLIENKGVTQFYSGFRGDFDVFCSSLIYELKARYPQIRNTMVLSYMPTVSAEPDNSFKLPEYFDDSVYLLDRQVPKRLAIVETNKCLVDKIDYIVAGVIMHFGGAYMACKYACERKKQIISVFENCELKT